MNHVIFLVDLKQVKPFEKAPIDQKLEIDPNFGGRKPIFKDKEHDLRKTT